MRLENEVRKVEAEFMREGKMFTALDVGNELKRRGVNARQRQVSPIVREHFDESVLYSSFGYTRMLIPVREGREAAYLYFNVNDEPMMYQDTEQRVLPWKPNKPMFKDQAPGIKITLTIEDLYNTLGKN
ncbi:hypothetical protein KY316_03715 [Candidatus Woesearchaeota archaeon]|nr:hypothetical protein [Candidatus Woesearchaeota archaeon]